MNLPVVSCAPCVQSTVQANLVLNQYTIFPNGGRVVPKAFKMEDGHTDFVKAVQDFVQAHIDEHISGTFR